VEKALAMLTLALFIAFIVTAIVGLYTVSLVLLCVLLGVFIVTVQSGNRQYKFFQRRGL